MAKKPKGMFTVRTQRQGAPFPITVIRSLLAALLRGSGGLKNAKSADGLEIVTKDRGVLDLKIKSEDVGVSTLTDREDGKFEYQTTDGAGGEVIISSGTNKLPEHFPKEIAIPEGAEIINAMKTSTGEGVGYIVTIKVCHGIRITSDFYRKAFQDNSFVISEFSDESTVNLIGGNDTYSFLVGYG